MTGNLDNMSESELELKLKQILDDHKNIINITGEETTSSQSVSVLTTDEESSEDQDLSKEESPSTSH